MRRLRLLFIPLLAFIVGGTMLYDAIRKAKRAAMVQAEPAEVTCKALFEDGVPENRHVKITDCWYADEFVWDKVSDRDEWICALVPIYPASVEAACTGENVRLIGRFNVRNYEELQDYISLHENEALGCIWDDYRGSGMYHDLLLAAYPQLEPGSYRVVYLNGTVPTMEDARNDALIAAAVITAGILLALWILRGVYRARRRDRNQVWFADPRDESRQYDHAAEALFGHLDRPSDIMTTLRTWAVIGSFVMLPFGAIFYFAEKLEVLPPPTGMGAAATCVVLFFVCNGIFLWTGRYFREQVYEMPHNRQLPRATRKYFERQTAPLAEQGFIHLGDIRVTESMRVWVRLLVSPDGTCLATLESLFHMGCYNLMSVADDGVLLHSVSIDLERNRDTPLPSWCTWLPTDHIRLAFSQHRAIVAQYLRSKPAASECLAIDPEYALGLMDYAHRISGWSLLEYGITRKRLPPLPRADQLTRVVDGRKTFAWQARPNDIVWSSDVLAAVRAAISHVEPPLKAMDDEPEELLVSRLS